MNKKEEGFYDEADNKGRRPCCSCWTMMITFFVLLAVGVAGLWWLIRAIKEPNQSKNPVVPSETAFQSLVEKVQGLGVDTAGNKVSNQAINRDLTLTVTQEELTSLIAKSGSLEGEGAAIKDISARITTDQINLSGTLTKPFKTDLTVVVVPRVESGKIVGEIVKIQAGKLAAPPQVADYVSGYLSQILKNQLNREEVVYRSITLKQGELVLVGQVRN